MCAEGAVDIAGNLARVRERMASACQRSGRRPEDVTLICVTKTWPAQMVAHAIAAGADVLGENYVQEAEDKIAALGHGVKWHFIGGLQRNKAGKAVELFDMVQSVGSQKLAVRLNDICGREGRTLEVLIEVNIAGEGSKSGVAASEALDLAEQVAVLPNLRLRGIMGIPPFLDDPDKVRPFFRSLREIWQSLPQENRKVLSMGMSGDFEAAIEEGSTMVRVGSAIFGPRHYAAVADPAQPASPAG